MVGEPDGRDPEHKGAQDSTFLHLPLGSKIQQKAPHVNRQEWASDTGARDAKSGQVNTHLTAPGLLLL
jgi:hypothetical protein